MPPLLNFAGVKEQGPTGFPHGKAVYFHLRFVTAGRYYRRPRRVSLFRRLGRETVKQSSYPQFSAPFRVSHP
jgi:hypothetical protein